MRNLTTVLLLCMSFATLSIAWAGVSLPVRLLEGVADFPKAGVPGAVAVFSPKADVLVAGTNDGGHAAVVAVAEHGRGKVAVLAHPGYLAADSTTNPSTAALLGNIHKWFTERIKSPVAAFYGGENTGPALERIGIASRKLDSPTPEALAGLTVLYYSPRSGTSPEEVDAIRAFVEKGGCLAVSFAGWIWENYWSPGGDLLTECPVNQLLSPMGFAFTGETVDSIAKLSPDSPALGLLNAATALDELLKLPEKATGPADDLRRKSLCRAVERAIPWLHDRSELIQKLRKVVPKDCGPTPDEPANLIHPLRRLAAALFHRDTRSPLASSCPVAPGVEQFPGAITGNATAVSREITADLSVARWVGTGLYALPAKAVTIEVQSPEVPKGLRIRIGAHKDTIWHKDAWLRHPEVSRTALLNSPRLTLRSPFGGLVYLEVPSGLAGQIDITVKGAVAAPRFVLGETKPSEWRRLREAPAPWAELETSRVILTLPSVLVRQLDDPESLMKKWDEILGFYSDLDAKPLPPRPERMVVDRQISAGYMHSGYPIMMETLDAADRDLVDLRRIVEFPEKCWGLWHELGHNHQESDWTFDGAVEVTVNLFTLYVIERLTGRKTAIEGEWKERYDRYMKGKMTLKNWGDSPKEALCMYIQIVQAFGWEPFTRVFAEYRALTPDQRPKSDDEKRDQWLVRMSRTLGKDLSAFFDRWGVPVSAEAKKSVSSLPQWLP